jgi:hypothetical protein
MENRELRLESFFLIIFTVLASNLQPLPFIFFFTVLELIKSMIKSLLGHQFGMGPDLTDLPFMENDNSISMLNRGEAMGNDNRCPPFEQSC